MKFGKEDVGIYVTGATVYNVEEQGFRLVDFAVSNGFEIDMTEYDKARDEYANNFDELSYDWFEDFGWLVEDAIGYLNTHCVDSGVVFTFIDTDFVLIDVNGLDNAQEGMVS